jgi:hypothetical protein
MPIIIHHPPGVTASLAAHWKDKATKSREEAGRIRRTIKAPTDAEERCLVRAEVWDKCAEQLLALVNIPTLGENQ